jgi:hypothetical protein
MKNIQLQIHRPEAFVGRGLTTNVQCLRLNYFRGKDLRQGLKLPKLARFARWTGRRPVLRSSEEDFGVPEAAGAGDETCDFGR